jgi:hypothetical protein
MERAYAVCQHILTRVTPCKRMRWQSVDGKTMDLIFQESICIKWMNSTFDNPVFYYDRWKEFTQNFVIDFGFCFFPIRSRKDTLMNRDTRGLSFYLRTWMYERVSCVLSVIKSAVHGMSLTRRRRLLLAISVMELVKSLLPLDFMTSFSFALAFAFPYVHVLRETRVVSSLFFSKTTSIL